MNEFIRRMRIRRNLTQKNLADNVGVKQSTISRLENNCNNVSWNLIQKIFIYLRLTNSDINNFFQDHCNKNHYNFFMLLLQDRHIREAINNNPNLFLSKIKQNIYI